MEPEPNPSFTLQCRDQVEEVHSNLVMTVEENDSISSSSVSFSESESSNGTLGKPMG